METKTNQRQLDRKNRKQENERDSIRISFQPTAKNERKRVNFHDAIEFL